MRRIRNALAYVGAYAGQAGQARRRKAAAHGTCASSALFFSAGIA
jgi:hypothetical protein